MYKAYDLEERTTQFAEEVIELCKTTKINIINKNSIQQLIKSATSVGANSREANGASSKKDFKNKISYCKKDFQHHIKKIDKMRD